MYSCIVYSNFTEIQLGYFNSFITKNGVTNTIVKYYCLLEVDSLGQMVGTFYNNATNRLILMIMFRQYYIDDCSQTPNIQGDSHHMPLCLLFGDLPLKRWV